MTRSLLAYVAVCISFMTATTGAHAQVAGDVALLETKKDAVKIYRPSYFAKDNSSDLNFISTRAVKNFKRSYKKAINENWSKTEDGFTAKFNTNGISHSIFYNKNGRWAASLKIYGEENASGALKDMIKWEYSDYKINGVQEIETRDTRAGVPTYFVYIQDCNKFKVIRASDGIMEVYQEFKSNN